MKRPDLSPGEQIQRARNAKRLFDDEILIEAFEMAEVAFAQQWRDSEPKDVAARESAYAKIQALAEVQRVLRSIISDGELQVGRLRRKGASEVPSI